MSEDQFEEFFRNKLGNYPSEVPQDMWQRIQQKKDKDRKIFFLRWPFAVIAISALLGAYFIFNAKNNTGHDKISNLVSKQKIEKQDITKLPESKETGRSTSLNQHPKNIKTKGNRILSSNQFDVTANNKSDIYPYRQQNKKSKTLRATSSSINIDINNGSASLIDNSKTDKNTGVENSDTLNTKQEIKNPSKDSSSKKILTQSQNKKENKPSTAKNKKWSVDLYASPDLPFFVITPGNANIVDYIKRTHKIQPSFTIGLKASRSFAKHFSVKAGFQYSQVNEKFPDSGLINNVNRYRSIDVPVLISYELTNINFRTAINAGVIFNLYSWYKGRTIDTIGAVDINAPNIFKHSTGISLYAGVNLAKPINNKLELFTEPYFRYRLSYMTKPQAPFKQKINIAGISFGLKYNF